MRKTYGVAAAMHAQFRGERDSGAEPENGEESIERDRDGGVDHQTVFDGGWDEVAEEEQAQDAADEGEVDGGWVALEGLGDHVARQRGDEDGEESL